MGQPETVLVGKGCFSLQEFFDNILSFAFPYLKQSFCDIPFLSDITLRVGWLVVIVIFQELVVLLFFIGISEQIITLGNYFKIFFSILIFWISVGMIQQGKLMVAFFYFRKITVQWNLHQFIKIVFYHIEMRLPMIEVLSAIPLNLLYKDMQKNDNSERDTIYLVQFSFITLSMKRCLLLIFVLNCKVFALFSQMSVDKSVFDFGQVENYNNDTAYFYFTNNGSKTVYFLPVQPGENYQVLCNTKTIAPGEVLTIGLIYYTEKRGKFNLEVPMNFSNSPQPIILRLTGQIKSISPNALTICPSIENSKPLNHTVPLNIVVRIGQLMNN